MTTTTNPLAKHIGSGKNVQINRDLENDPSVSGYVLAASDDLALLHTFDDFDPDGYMIIRVDDIEDVDAGEDERHWHRMLEGEGLLGGLDIDFTIDLSSWASAIESVHRLFGKMIIEAENQGEDDDDDDEAMFIGCVVEIGDREVEFDTVDGTGEWDEDAEELAFLDITTVQFETPYLRRFWKYVDGSAPNAG